MAASPARVVDAAGAARGFAARARAAAFREDRRRRRCRRLAEKRCEKAAATGRRNNLFIARSPSVHAGLRCFRARLQGRRRLQAASWFVTTVKHGTALEALARRRPRLDILKTFILLRFATSALDSAGRAYLPSGRLDNETVHGERSDWSQALRDELAKSRVALIALRSLEKMSGAEVDRIETVLLV